MHRKFPFSLEKRWQDPKGLIQVFVGPHQVGKTTAAEFLTQKNSTVFASADNPALRQRLKISVAIKLSWYCKVTAQFLQLVPFARPKAVRPIGIIGCKCNPLILLCFMGPTTSPREVMHRYMVSLG